MDIATTLSANAITGLVVLTARSLLLRYQNNKLNKRRLGDWQKEIFSSRFSDIVKKDKKVGVPIIFDPEVYEEANIKKCNPEHAIDDLGVVCWRNLINKIYDEADLIRKYNKNSETWYYSSGEVGGYRDNVAARVKVSTMYKYIFSNLNPRHWNAVTLGKEERISTNIGEFCSLYFQNMRWFHYSPCNYDEPNGKYRQVFNTLVEKGHTIKAPGLDELESKGLLEIGSTSRSNAMSDGEKGKEIVEFVIKNMSNFFSKKRRRDMEDVYNEVENDDWNDSIFRGGIMTPNAVEEFVPKATKILFAFTSWLEDELTKLPIPTSGETYEARNKDLALVKGKEALENQLWIASTQRDLVEACSAATAIALWIARTCSTFQLHTGLADTCIKFGRCARYLGTNFVVLGWNKEDWKQQDSFAWLAGIKDSVQQPEDAEDNNDYYNAEFSDKEESE